MVAILAARCSFVPRKRRSLAPGCKITMSVPLGTSLSIRLSMPAVVSNGTPALMTCASMPLASSKASNLAGYAPCLPTYQPCVLLAPIATIRSCAAAAVVTADRSTITAKSIALNIVSTHSGLRNSFGFADNNGSGCDGNQTSRLTRRFESCVSLHMHEVEQRLKCDDKGWHPVSTAASSLARLGQR